MAFSKMIQPPPQFNATPDSIAADAQHLVKHSRWLRDELVRNIAPSAATFANVMLPLAHMENNFARKSALLGFFQYVSEDDQVRDASVEAQTLFDNFRTESMMRQDIFALVDAVRKSGEDLDQESSLYLKCVYNAHIRKGVGIQDAAQRQRLKTIQARLSQIQVDYDQILCLDKSSICFTSAELEGVPQSVLSQLERNEEKDEYQAVLSDPSHTEIMSYAEKSETRKRLFIACTNRCSENAPLIKEAVILRYERARLLGFSNNAAFQLENKMAKTPDTVNKFLADLQSKLTAGGLTSLQRLKDLKEADLQRRGETGQHNGQFFQWDYDFYHNLMMKKLLSYDREQIKEYFPIQTTIEAMLKMQAQIFGLEFTELKGSDRTAEIVWHKDVQIFEAHDDQARGGNILGYLYLDLFHRLGKYPHEACFSLQPGFTREDGSRHHPVTAILCDFPKPNLSKPSLLRHFDTVPIFHELGHGIHNLVSKTRYSRFHGSGGVAVDFGELPSQMLEQWCWMPPQLKSLTLHYTCLGDDMLKAWEKENKGLPRPEKQMPDVLIEALIQSRRFTFGPLFHLEQLHMAIFDMTIHQLSSLEEAHTIDLATTWNKLRQEICLIDGPEVLDEDYTWGQGYTTFSHLMSNDYDAGYYAYSFSQVYAADLFESQFKDDITNRERGQKYRQCVLEKGGSQDEMQSLVRFLGREPSAKAFNDMLLDHTLLVFPIENIVIYMNQIPSKRPDFRDILETFLAWKHVLSNKTLIQGGKDFYIRGAMASGIASKVIGKKFDVDYVERRAVRVIVKNKYNEIILIHVAKGNYFKLPGGGMEGDEDHGPAAEREAFEETGCRVQLDGQCMATAEEWRNDLHQISYCYVAGLVEDTGAPELTDLEKEEGLKHEWLSVQGALEKMKTVQPTSELGIYIKERDVFFVETFANS